MGNDRAALLEKVEQIISDKMLKFTPAESDSAVKAAGFELVRGALSDVLEEINNAIVETTA